MRVIIVGPPRSGTTAVVALLNKHPKVAPLAYEIFHAHLRDEDTGVRNPSLQNFLKAQFGIEKYPSPVELEKLNTKLITKYVLKRYNGFKILYGQITRTSSVWTHLL